ncbi:MAG: hypothetical protein LBM00_11655 [Deltaproteobacteria bacterium]|jgi:drug/metabolite transporter (DMT)-like permease|nr:hypothetical protein [Deltaproteobacteria bacterium]
MLTVTELLLLLFLAVIGAVSQLCLKRAANTRRPGNVLDFMFSPWVVAGVSLMLGNILALTVLMRRLPLTLVMPLTAMVYVFVPFGGKFFFHEKLKRSFWLGCIGIVLGISMINV